jgi:acetyl-CoA carboxylase biotin carboxyl carrier protein
MEENNIRKYAALMQELGLTGLEVSEDGCVIRLERNQQGNIGNIVLPQEAPAPPIQQKTEDGYTDISSPLIGVFYAAPTEDGKPFVQVGDRIKKGDVLCIIEAMKLMNEITAEEDGVIAEICMVNGQVIDYGQTLFRLKKE